VVSKQITVCAPVCSVDYKPLGGGGVEIPASNKCLFGALASAAIDSQVTALSGRETGSLTHAVFS
jgi:hypothetical protein